MGISRRYSMKVLHTQGVMNTHTTFFGSKGMSTGVALRQRVQQCLRLLQIRGVKSLGEPPVDRREERVGLSALTLVLPQPGEAHGDPQLQGLRLLATGNVKGLVETGLSLGLVCSRVRQQ